MQAKFKTDPTLKTFSLIFIGLLVINAAAQETDTLHLDLPEAEGLLLHNNLGLLAEQLNIDKTEAEMVQARVWPNPRLSIDEINPYVTSYQKRHAEEQASLFGSEEFGRYRQISVQLEQLIELGGKRKKRKAMAEVSTEKAHVYLADFLLDLKTSFRKTVFSFYYHHKYLEMLEKERRSLKQIVSAYRAQQSKGNVNKTELIRLRSLQMSLTEDIVEQHNTLSKLESDLIVLLNLPDETSLVFKDVFNRLSTYRSLQKHTVSTLQDKALEHHPDMRLSKLAKKGAEKRLDYEKSMTVPDLSLSLSYDRGGGIYPDFVGLGLAIDLPFSKPNKGDLKKAQITVKQESYRLEKHRKSLRGEVRRVYDKLRHLNDFFTEIEDDYPDDLDHTMEVYERHFQQRTINTFQFVDFMESYQDNQKAILQKKRDYHNAIEELKYATGLDDLTF